MELQTKKDKLYLGDSIAEDSLPEGFPNRERKKNYEPHPTRTQRIS